MKDERRFALVRRAGFIPSGRISSCVLGLRILRTIVALPLLGAALTGCLAASDPCEADPCGPSCADAARCERPGPTVQAAPRAPYANPAPPTRHRVMSCAQGGCRQLCETYDVCKGTCDGGGCTQTCIPGADCTFSCDGGGCTQACRDATCDLSCAGAGCIDGS